jgi:hypothetical protein
VQVIVGPKVTERLRAPLLRARRLEGQGHQAARGALRNLIAGHLEVRAPLLGALAVGSREVR